MTRCLQHAAVKNLNVPRAELQKLRKGRGREEERGKVKHVSVSVCKDLGKYVF
jgi:hypothetical protein